MRNIYKIISLMLAIVLSSLNSSAQNCPFEEIDGVVSFEAEDFFEQTKDAVRKWYVIGNGTSTPTPDPDNHSGASGGKYIELLPDTRVVGHSGPGPEDPLIRGENFEDNPGRMAVVKYKVYFNNPGKYFVWVRANSSGPEDNGVHVGIDGTWPASGERMQWCLSKNQWHWESKQRTSSNHCGDPRTSFVNVPNAGIHTIEFSMREDGFEMDKVVLSKEYTKPSGTGPAVRTRDNCSSNPTSCTIPTPINNANIAYVADGNSPDPDDIGAAAVTLALLRATGMEKNLVFAAHSCDLDPFRNPGSQSINATQEANRQVVMQEAFDGTASRWGGFEHLTTYNCRTQQTLATNKLRDAINNATSSKRLSIILAGEPDVIYDAVKAADASKRQYVTIVSHHVANEESADTPGKNISNLKVDYPTVTVVRIDDQNEKLQTPLSSWHWARDHSDSRIKWLWQQGKIAEQDPVVGFQSGKFDCSDAGMVYYQLYGKRKPTVSDFRQILECYVDGGGNTGENTPPVVSFTAPTETSFDQGVDLGPVVSANDPDGSIDNVKLYLNDVLVREEKQGPYEWGTASSQNDAQFLNMESGTYVLKAVATDDKGATAEKTLTITVKEEKVAPTITITSPKDGDEFEVGDEIVLSANSWDANGNHSHVNFKVNGSFYKQDGERPFETTYTPTEPGTYTLGARGFDLDDLSTEVSVIVTVKKPIVTGISSRGSRSELLIAPNPSSSGVFHLSKKVSYELFSLTGEPIESGSGNEVDLSSNVSGVYILRTPEGVYKLIR